MNGPLAALTIQQFLNDHLANWLPFTASGDLVALMAFLAAALVHATLLISLFAVGILLNISSGLKIEPIKLKEEK